MKPLTQARLIVAASETNADLLYATHFFAPDPFIFFIHRGRKHLVLSDLEIDRARQQASVRTVLSLSQMERQLQSQGAKKTGTAEVLLLLFSQKKVRAVEVPYEFPSGLADQLQRGGLRVVSVSGQFFPEREIKRSDEVEAIRKAQRAAEIGMQAALEILRQSRIRPNGRLVWQGVTVTSDILKRRIAAATQEKRCLASRTIVACGDQGCDPHQEGSGPIRANQPIILDIFPRSEDTGYWGDLTRTVVKGRANERLKAQYQAVLAGQQRALRQIKAGVKGSQVHQAVADFFDGQGFATGIRNGRHEGFFHGTGHGVGLEIHEPPRLSLKGTSLLKAGHVVTVEPGLYYPGVGGVRLEDLVVVTTDGIQNLTRLPKFLEIP